MINLKCHTYYQHLKQEEEAEAEAKISQLLKEMDDKLTINEWGTIDDPLNKFEDEEADGDSFHRNFLIDRSKHQKRSRTNELESYCKQWGAQFCHLGYVLLHFSSQLLIYSSTCLIKRRTHPQFQWLCSITGTSIIAERSNNEFIKYEECSIGENSVPQSKLALFGGIEEETIEANGEYSEIIAMDVTRPEDESQKDMYVQRAKRYEQKGFPPINPEDNIMHNVVKVLFRNIWGQLCDMLKPLFTTYVISRAASRHSARKLKKDTKKQKKEMPMGIGRKHMNPSHSSTNQNIQYGLGDAVSVRPYRKPSANMQNNGGQKAEEDPRTKKPFRRKPPVQNPERNYNQTLYKKEKETPFNPHGTAKTKFPPIHAMKPMMKRTNTFDNSIPGTNVNVVLPSISGPHRRKQRFSLARSQTAIQQNFLVPSQVNRPISTRSKQRNGFQQFPKRDTLFQNYSVSDQKVVQLDPSLSVQSAPLHPIGNGSEENNSNSPTKFNR